ncbi:hypothetical protein K438DRAFT_2082237 [Mycena galopus ATCC 62051]|nr:hypothetical protein K438DRAFT_2082237 [Mycena galopus ATCC 62051]
MRASLVKFLSARKKLVTIKDRWNVPVASLDGSSSIRERNLPWEVLHHIWSMDVATSYRRQGTEHSIENVSANILRMRCGTRNAQILCRIGARPGQVKKKNPLIAEFSGTGVHTTYLIIPCTSSMFRGQICRNAKLPSTIAPSDNPSSCQEGLDVTYLVAASKGVKGALEPERSACVDNFQINSTGRQMYSQQVAGCADSVWTPTLRTESTNGRRSDSLVTVMLAIQWQTIEVQVQFKSPEFGQPARIVATVQLLQDGSLQAVEHTCRQFREAAEVGQHEWAWGYSGRRPELMKALQSRTVLEARRDRRCRARPESGTGHKFSDGGNSGRELIGA